MLVELSACVGGGGLEIVHSLVYCGFFRFEGGQVSEAVCGGKRSVPAAFGGVNARFLRGMALSIANDGFLQGVFQPIRLKGVLLKLLCERFGRFRFEAGVSRMNAHFLHDRSVLCFQGIFFFSETPLERLELSRVEQGAKYSASFVGARGKQLAEISLCDHDDLGELRSVYAEYFLYGGVNVAHARYGRFPRSLKDRLGGLRRSAFAAFFGAFVSGAAPYTIEGAAVSEFKLDACFRCGVGEVASKRLRAAVVAACAAEQGERYGVEDGGLACARIARDEVEPVVFEPGEVYLGRFGVGTECVHGELDGSHRFSSLF